MYINCRLDVSITLKGADVMMQILRDNKKKLAFLVISWSLYGAVHAPESLGMTMEVQHAE
jgi:hypothetical protein